jgi:hypothetical protein
MKASGKPSNQLPEISDYMGSGSEMEEWNSVLIGCILDLM